MLNLKEIQAVQGNLSQQKQLRAGRGEAAFQEGLEWLERYNLKPGRELLLQAMAKFIECMSHQRNRVEPVAMLAYIYYALKSPQLAARYYRLAVSIDPQAPEVKRLQAILTRQEPVPTIAEAQQAQAGYDDDDSFSLIDFEAADDAPLAEDIDLDALYDEVEDFMRQEIQRLVAQPLAMKPALDQRAQAKLAQQQQALTELLAGLRRQLDILDDEIDVQPLQTGLHPFEVRLRQLQRLVDASSQAGEIMARLETAQAVTETELAREPLNEQALDPLLDQCDYLADQIDGLDKQGIEIQILEARYSELVAQLTRFQDLLEDSEA